jgi:hypothetical protein
MKTYLRFTPAEYHAISRACRSVTFHEDSFPRFKHFLVESLRETLPELARRIAGLHKYQIGIIFEHLREQRRAARPAAPADSKPGSAHDLTPPEWQAVSLATRAYGLPDGFPDAFREFLVRHFRRTAPELSGKIARFSDPQVDRLYAEVKGLRKRSA